MSDASKLPPYSGAGKCPKCNSSEISTGYRNAQGKDGGYYEWRDSPTSGEWLRRTCRNCHFGWNERTAQEGEK